MTAIDFVVLAALGVGAIYIYFLGQGERGELFSRAWPIMAAEVEPSDPADEGAQVVADERGGRPEEPRKAA